VGGEILEKVFEMGQMGNRRSSKPEADPDQKDPKYRGPIST